MSDPVHSARVIVAAQNRARDLANTPANDLTPTALAAYVTQTAKRLSHLNATVLGEDEIRATGMGAFAAVAQGSEQPAQLIRLDYEGPGAAEPRLALVGKAVTFDTGGISLKPAAKMHEMKFDMAGGAAVIEAIAAIAELEFPVRVLGRRRRDREHARRQRNVGRGTSSRAQDGTTIEINNTDAEGRLVLADCLAYALARGLSIGSSTSRR